MDSAQDITFNLNISAKIWKEFCNCIGTGNGTWGADKSRIWHILNKANLP